MEKLFIYSFEWGAIYPSSPKLTCWESYKINLLLPFFGEKKKLHTKENATQKSLVKMMIKKQLVYSLC